MFPYRERYCTVGLKLNIPPFAFCASQMKAFEVAENVFKKAKHRVHVERAIDCIKQFKILSGKNWSLFFFQLLIKYG